MLLLFGFVGFAALFMGAVAFSKDADGSDRLIATWLFVMLTLSAVVFAAGLR